MEKISYFARVSECRSVEKPPTTPSVVFRKENPEFACPLCLLIAVRLWTAATSLNFSVLTNIVGNNMEESDSEPLPWS